jgi:glycosyltransferase involved in cell wall biosynthesis
MTSPLITVAIPNFNYANFLGATIESVLAQHRDDIEIVVSDNASTDNSIQLIRSFGSHVTLLNENRRNIGFAPNLDRAARLATGRFIVTVSADDLVLDGAFDAYARLISHFGDSAERCVIASCTQTVDEHGARGDVIAPPERIWDGIEPDPEASSLIDHQVLRAPASIILHRSMRAMRNPFPFSSTLFPRVLYDEVEGYAALRFLNPDKWFHWKLLSVADEVAFVNTPLFGYRRHSENQLAQQSRARALKHLVDEYVTTFDVDAEMLTIAGLTRDEFVTAYVRNDIIERAAAQLAFGNRAYARRTLNFGLATNPGDVRRQPLYLPLRALARCGPVGSFLARLATGLRARRSKSDRNWWSSTLRRDLTRSQGDQAGRRRRTEAMPARTSR